MNTKLISRLLLTAFTILCACLVIISGCAIEESDKGLTGTVLVSLKDADGFELSGAQIYIDDALQSQRTPATLTEVAVGSRALRLSRPGYNDASSTVEVLLNQTVQAQLQTTLAPVGAIKFSAAPEGTTLLVNNIPFGTTPPDVFSVGIGSYVVSAYLPGNATALPSFWNIQITAGDTVEFAPTFVPVAEGARPDSLAPDFALIDDRDSTRLRLSDYRGRVCVVTFYYYYCAPCLAEFPYFQSVYGDPDYAGKIEFFGIDSDDPWSLFERYRRDHPTLGLTFPLVFDPGGPTTRDYAVLTHPANFVIDKTGRIRYRFGQTTESILRNAVDALLAE